MEQHEILNHLLEELERIPDCEVSNVVLGSRLGIVETTGAGFASLRAHGQPFDAKELASRIIRKPAKEVCRYVLSDDPVEASVGLACFNSLIPLPPEGELVNIKAQEVILQYGRGKNVAVIGHFPFVERMGEDFDNFWVLEKRLRPGNLTDKEAASVLPRADLVAISATTLANGTLAGILELIPANAKTILLGQSTPLSARLFEFGLDVLAGAVITDRELAISGVSAGLSFKELKGVKHVVWHRPG